MEFVKIKNLFSFYWIGECWSHNYYIFYSLCNFE